MSVPRAPKKGAMPQLKKPTKDLKGTAAKFKWLQTDEMASTRKMISTLNETSRKDKLKSSVKIDPWAAEEEEAVKDDKLIGGSGSAWGASTVPRFLRVKSSPSLELMSRLGPGSKNLPEAQDMFGTGITVHEPERKSRWSRDYKRFIPDAQQQWLLKVRAPPPRRRAGTPPSRSFPRAAPAPLTRPSSCACRRRTCASTSRRT